MRMALKRGLKQFWIERKGKVKVKGKGNHTNPFWKLWHIFQPANLEAVEKKGPLKRIMKVSPNSFLLFFAVAAPSEISNSIRAAIADDCISQHFTQNDLGIKCNGHLNSLQYEYLILLVAVFLSFANLQQYLAPFEVEQQKAKGRKCLPESYRDPSLTPAVFKETFNLLIILTSVVFVWMWWF